MYTDHLPGKDEFCSGPHDFCLINNGESRAREERDLYLSWLKKMFIHKGRD